jgi:dihydropteroate synthase
MLDKPKTMQENPRYADVVADVRDFLAKAVDRCVAAGI